MGDISSLIGALATVFGVAITLFIFYKAQQNEARKNLQVNIEDASQKAVEEERRRAQIEQMEKDINAAHKRLRDVETKADNAHAIVQEFTPKMDNIMLVLEKIDKDVEELKTAHPRTSRKRTIS